MTKDGQRDRKESEVLEKDALKECAAMEGELLAKEKAGISTSKASDALDLAEKHAAAPNSAKDVVDTAKLKEKEIIAAANATPQAATEENRHDDILADIDPLPSENNNTARETTPGAFAVVTPRANDPNATQTASPPASDDEESASSEAPLTLTAHLSPDEVRPTTLQGPQGEIDPDIEQQQPQEPSIMGRIVTKEEEDMERQGGSKGQIYVVVAALLTIILVLALGLAGVFDKKGNVDNSEATYDSLLQEIRARGYLECAYNGIPFMMHRDNDTNAGVGGVNSVWCKAIAAAIWGDEDGIWESEDPTSVLFANDRIHYHDYIEYGLDNFVERDVHAVSFTHTMQRETDKSIWRAFSTPFYYDGARVGGESFYVECVEEKGFRNYGECADLRVCVMNESTPMIYAQNFISIRQIYPYRSPVDAILGFVNGTCNTFLMESLGVAEGTVRYFGYNGTDYAKGEAMYSKEPITVVTPQHDTAFADFVNAIVHATLVAEQHGISRANADQFPPTEVFGELYKNIFRNVVRTVGNYGDIYSEHLEGSFPREPINQLNNGSTTGLMYPHPFGHLGQTKEDHYDTFGPNIQRIMDRKKLLCGVRDNRPGFVHLTSNGTARGFEIDLCRALAASLFWGDSGAIELVELSSQEEGFEMLANHQVDVVAGATWNLANDVNQTTTGLGFDFSQSYFFGYSEEEDNLCLATREDDHDWATYVYWIMASTIYAEEHGHSTNTSNSMPEVMVYGSDHRRMFRDAILMVGNYGDMYRRHLEEIYPRTGRNQLNGGTSPGPQHYPMPGLI